MPSGSEGDSLTKKYIAAIAAALIYLSVASIAQAGGMFGPPQTLSKKEGGINTAVGYGYAEDTYESAYTHVIRQNQIYSHAAYGASDLWEVYGRLGVSDLRLSDAFASPQILTVTSKNDFAENWKFFSTVGAKIFYPFNRFFGVGVFAQGTYHFSNYTDTVVGVYNAAPFEVDLKIKNLWDVNAGVGLQVMIPK
ncbi:MAG: hypothetical protein R6W75_11955, partial [Smithellaceae bacterium]